MLKLLTIMNPYHILKIMNCNYHKIHKNFPIITSLNNLAYIKTLEINIPILNYIIL